MLWKTLLFAFSEILKAYKHEGKTVMKDSLVECMNLFFHLCILLCLYLFIPAMDCLGQASQDNITLRVCAYEGYTEPFVDDFAKRIQKQFNVNVDFEITIAPNPDVMFYRAFDRKADLITPTHNLYKSKVWPFIENRVVHPINLSQIENYKHVLPVFQKNSYVTQNDNVYGTPLAAGYYALAYNADKLNEPPTSWDVLWNSDFKNQYSISEDYFDCNIYITALSMGVPYENLYNPGAIFQEIPLHRLRGRLNQLASNAFSFWESTPNVEEMKELSLVTTWGYAVVQANKQGMNWKMASPKEGTTAWFDHWSITHAVEADSLKYQICMEWLNYALSKKVQEQAVRLWGNTPVTTNVLDLFNEEEIDTYKIANNEYWSQISFWEVMDANTIRVGQALWRYAMAQKTSQDRMEEYFQDVRQTIESQVMPQRSKHLGQLDFSRNGENGQPTGLEANQAEFSAQIADDLLHRMRVMAIKRRTTMNELLEEAIFDYLKKNNELPASRR